VFSLRTHRSVFQATSSHAQQTPAPPAARAIAVLAGATVLVAVQSEILVHATEGVVARFGLSEMFLGLIVIPLIGNAAENAGAVVVARKGHTDLALSIALGSSTQVALFVAPLLVFAGMALGQPMTLVFTPLEVVALGLAALIVTVIALDGESHWFEGAQLLAAYAILAVAAWFI
jgi:Ca2+:H+ antiporter